MAPKESCLFFLLSYKLPGESADGNEERSCIVAKLLHQYAYRYKRTWGQKFLQGFFFPLWFWVISMFFSLTRMIEIKEKEISAWKHLREM
jgi:hypothetical protein